MKRLLLIALLALPIVGINNQAVANAPIPGCYPCKPVPPPDMDRAAVILPAEAR